MTRRLRRPVPGLGRPATLRGVVVVAGLFAASLLLAFPTVAVLIHEVDSTAPSTAVPPASTPSPGLTEPPSAGTLRPAARTAARHIGGPASTSPPDTGRIVVTLAHFPPPPDPVRGRHGGPRERSAGKHDKGHAKGHDKGGGKGDRNGRGGKGGEKN